jgi:hypothetical protein
VPNPAVMAGAAAANALCSSGSKSAPPPGAPPSQQPGFSSMSVGGIPLTTIALVGAGGLALFFATRKRPAAQ